MKTIRLNSVVYEMLLVVSKKRRQKPEDCVAKLVEQAYRTK